MKPPPCGWCDRPPSVWIVDCARLWGFCHWHALLVADRRRQGSGHCLDSDGAAAWLVVAEVLGS